MRLTHARGRGPPLSPPPAARCHGGEFAVTPIEVEETKAVFGKVESRDAVPARARIGGTVREIRVDEGSEVAEGDVVAVIVDDKLALQQQAADARIQVLTSQLGERPDRARARRAAAAERQRHPGQGRRGPHPGRGTTPTSSPRPRPTAP